VDSAVIQESRPRRSELKGLLSMEDAARKYEIPRRTLYARIMAVKDVYPGLLVAFVPPGARVTKWFLRERILRRIIDGED
jgi:hypothetical protein